MHKYIFALMNMGQWWAVKLKLHKSCCCLELNLDLATFFHHSITTYAEVFTRSTALKFVNTVV